MSISFYIKNKKKFLSYETVLNVEETTWFPKEVDTTDDVRDYNFNLTSAEKRNSTCVLAESGAHSENITRMVADGGNIDNYNTLIGQAPNVNGYLGCDGLMLSDGGQISSTPQVTAKSTQVNLSHEASIGMVGKDKLAYLMSSGMTEDEARDLIVQGFLDLEHQHIPKGLRDMVKRMIDTAKSGSM